jgi:hypothetical protein
MVAVWGMLMRRHLPAYVTVMVIAFMVAALLVCLAPHPAWATTLADASPNFFLDPVGAINYFFCNLLFGIAEVAYKIVGGVIGAIKGATNLGAGFTALFGKDVGNVVYKVADTVSQTIIKPIGYALLTLVSMIQLIKIVTKAQGNDGANLGRDICYLLITFLVLWLVVAHSQDIVVSIYNLFNVLTNNPSIDPGSASAVFNLDAARANIDVGAPNVMGALTFLVLGGVITLLLSLVVYVITIVMVYARAIQIYFYFMIAPIPLSFLGLDDTRNIGINFLRNFAAVAFTGFIMAFLLFLFPVIFGAIATSTLSVTSISDILNVAPGGMLLKLLELVAILVMLGLGMVKSGAWARSVFGE